MPRRPGHGFWHPPANGRIERGAGRVGVERIPYPVDLALDLLKDLEHLVLVGAKAPVAFFAYPEKPSVLTPAGCEIHALAGPGQDLGLALEALTDALGAARQPFAVEPLQRCPLPEGPITGDAIARALCALLPENAIIVDESITEGRSCFGMLKTAPPHDWLQLTGGAIGDGLPMATGAAIACPDRRVICLEADGSAMYNLQALWTQAREGLNVTTVIFNNRAYATLRKELANVGARNAGPKALQMMSLDQPAIDWCGLARSLGVAACRATAMADFNRAFAASMMASGPSLIEAVL